MMSPADVCRMLCHTAALRLWEAQGSDLVSFLPAAATAHEDPAACQALWADLWACACRAASWHERCCPECAPRRPPTTWCPGRDRLGRLLYMAGHPGRLELPPAHNAPRHARQAAVEAQAARVTGTDALGTALILVADLGPVTDDAIGDALLARIVEAWAVAQLL